MSPDEVLKKLKALGIASSRATLLRNKDAKLISQPEEGGGGRGVGRYTDYPSETVFEYFASHHIIKGKHASSDKVAAARRVINEFAYIPPIGILWDEYDAFKKEVVLKFKEKYNKNPQRDELLVFAAEIAIGKNYDQFKSFEYVLDTEFAVEWWELRQIAAGKIDEVYVEFCDRVQWSPQFACRSHSKLIDMRINRLHHQLAEIYKDIDLLFSLRDGSELGDLVDPTALHPLGRWMALCKLYPDLQLLVRNAMLTNYRNIRPQTLDLLIAGKLPEV